MSGLRRLAFLTALFAYAVIVFGFVVRITGSGMGCGPDWPLCNGRVIPVFTGPDVVIEWLHRVSVLGLSLLTLAVCSAAFMRRRQPGGLGRGGTFRPAVLLALLFVVQSLLGRQAVVLELEALTVVAHLGGALAVLTVLLVLGLRAGGAPSGIRDAPGQPRVVAPGAVWGALALGGVAILLGGLTANHGAMGACVGFPLCSGQLWPATGLAQLHWIHRLVAYMLLLHVLGLVLGVWRRGAAGPVAVTVWLTGALVLAQVAIAALMVTTGFPMVWRVLHAVVGTGIWVVMVWLAWLTLRRPAGPT